MSRNPASPVVSVAWLTLGLIISSVFVFLPMRASAQDSWKPWERVYGDKSMQGCGVDFHWKAPPTDEQGHISSGNHTVFWSIKNSCATSGTATIYTDDYPKGDQQTILPNKTVSGGGAWTPGTIVTRVVVTMDSPSGSQPSRPAADDATDAIAFAAIHDAAVKLLSWWNSVVQAAANTARQAQLNPFGNVGTVLKEYTDQLARAREQARQLQEALRTTNAGGDVAARIQELTDELRVTGQAFQTTAHDLLGAERTAERRAADSTARSARVREVVALQATRQEAQLAAVQQSQQMIVDFASQDNAELEKERQRIQSDLNGDSRTVRTAYAAGSDATSPEEVISAMQEAVQHLRDRADATDKDKKRTLDVSTSFGSVLRGFAAALTGDQGAAGRYSAFAKTAQSMAEVHDQRKEELNDAADDIEKVLAGLQAEAEARRQMIQRALAPAGLSIRNASAFLDRNDYTGALAALGTAKEQLSQLTSGADGAPEAQALRERTDLLTAKAQAEIRRQAIQRALAPADASTDRGSTALDHGDYAEALAAFKAAKDQLAHVSGDAVGAPESRAARERVDRLEGQAVRARQAERTVEVTRAVAPARESVALARISLNHGEYAEARQRVSHSIQLLGTLAEAMSGDPTFDAVSKDAQSLQDQIAKACQTEATLRSAQYLQSLKC